MNRQPPLPAAVVVPRSSAPTAMLSQGSIAQRPGPNRTISSLAGPVCRVVAALDARFMRMAVAPLAPPQANESLLEMALLAHLRRGLAPFAAEPKANSEPERIDTVLAETLLGAVDHAWAVLGELNGGPFRHAQQLLGFVRELGGELRALGGSNEAEKQRLDDAREALRRDGESAAPVAIAAALSEAAALYGAVRSKLDVHAPHHAPSLLDEWLRPAP